jgi:hypothetical protein
MCYVNATLSLSDSLAGGCVLSLAEGNSDAVSDGQGQMRKFIIQHHLLVICGTITVLGAMASILALVPLPFTQLKGQNEFNTIIIPQTSKPADDERQRTGRLSFDARPNHKTLESLDLVGTAKRKLTNEGDSQRLYIMYEYRVNGERSQAHLDFPKGESSSDTSARAGI